ncbi:MAG TPA: 50S ribosomal protein L36 [Candidatus Saccharimonadales bacterium]
MKVRASVKKISPGDKLVWRKPKRGKRGQGRKARLYVINKLRPKNKQRQG